MAWLGVNVDHVATIRQARGGREPDPVTAAALAELAGADGITVHLREDRRHIQDRDVRVLRETIQTRLNLEMAATSEMVGLAREIGPECVTLVPEKRQELTTEGGLDVLACPDLPQTVATLQASGILVSLFVDPDPDQVRAAHAAKADAVEIHTGSYCEAAAGEQAGELDKIGAAVTAARELGLVVNAGHGLNYRNIRPVLQFRDIQEYNIGHSIIARAILVGLSTAVREMADLIHGAGP